MSDIMGEWPAAVERLCGDVELRGTMGAVGRERVERELSVEILAERWAEVLG